MPARTLVDYYQQNNFNPVPIEVESSTVWESHLAKRRHLYEKHLKIPMSFLKGRDVIEFGCNSGENPLVLAHYGANLTLVEPNHQVIPRLQAIFSKFDLQDQLSELVQSGIEDFEIQRTYDVVIAESFIHYLPNRKLMLDKICQLLAPGGLGIVGFADIYGYLVEMTKRFILWRACYLSSEKNPESETSLELARRLYYKDFSNIAASRPFDAWWRDALVCPLNTAVNCWSYEEIIPQIHDAGCEFYSTSPKWETVSHFGWYKNVPNTSDLNKALITNWAQNLPYFLTGIPTKNGETRLPDLQVTESVRSLATAISDYTTPMVTGAPVPEYPDALHLYLNSFEDSNVAGFSADMKRIYETATAGSIDDLISTYEQSSYLRNSWGTSLQYLCIVKSI